ncbi:hypothetical protein B0J13DRAFT_305741 [Dactylonectria estremocensis]|uniref:DUF952 domain-containing protein n=1 Tax=Dactylonectria estremocensis TaxID=1079267 RepID=A0A9P9F0R0_9HYPO|nr:hypothetical protein B0J13DRAFT_305741 [Dactylonectria estremocensis]
MESNAPPTFVYKILPSAPPEPFPKVNPLSELDQKDGFVHLSTVTQVPATASLFFTEAPALWVVKLRFADFAESIKWEGGFPHLYDNFGVDVVDSVEKFVKPEGQTWAVIMKASTWLE